MAISQANLNQVEEALDMLSGSSVDVIYLVDSYGSLYPENAAALAKTYLDIAEKAGKKVGFHAHNNQNLAFPKITPSNICHNCDFHIRNIVSDNCPDIFFITELPLSKITFFKTFDAVWKLKELTDYCNGAILMAITDTL